MKKKTQIIFIKTFCLNKNMFCKVLVSVLLLALLVQNSATPLSDLIEDIQSYKVDDFNSVLPRLNSLLDSTG